MRNRNRNRNRHRLRCGRVILTKDGKVKKLALNKGGGSRFCDWCPDDLTFNKVRRRLIQFFNLGNIKKHQFL